MYCPHCGAALEPGMRYCPGCGAPRGTSPRPAWEDRGADSDLDPEIEFEPEPAPPRRKSRDSRSRQEPMRVATPPEQRVLVVHEHRYAGSGGSGKSYTIWAWVSLALYFAFYVPGLAANLFFWRSSVRHQRETGERARGSGCLLWLLWVVGIGIPVLFVLGAISGNGSGAGT